MTRKLATAVALSLAALAATLLAGPGGAAHRTFTISFVTGNTTSPRVQAIARGGRLAAKRLGLRYVLAGPMSTSFGVPAAIRSQIAHHVDAILSEGYFTQMTPVLTKVRKAGILLVSSGDDIAAKRDLWVSTTGPVAYANALADALASQLKGRGEYAILEEQDEFPVATTWAKLVAKHIGKAYPGMKLDGVVDGTGAGDESEVEGVKAYLSAHPNLKGLIGITPTEAYMAADAIIQSGRIGQVFSAGNGGGDFGDLLPGFVRSGAAEIVFVGNQEKLGYLTVWATHYLLTGHRFRFGAYQVGGPVGRVWYYPKHRELRLGQPLTITKKNVDRYANKF